MPIFPAIRSPGRLHAAFDYQHAHDRIGHRIHLACGMAWCLFVAAPTTVMEIAVAPLYVFSLWRFLNVRRTWPAVLLSPQFLLLLACAIWMSLTLLWSPDPYRGWVELNRLRFAFLIWSLWPIMDRRAWLLAALSAGFLVGNLAQGLHVLGHHFEVAWLDFDRQPDRYSGWWDPVVGGSLLCGALGIHIPAALRPGAARRLGLIGSGVTLLGILATGTRGAWIAAVILCAAALLAVLATGLRAGTQSRRTLWPIAAGLVILVAAGVVLAPSISRRAQGAWHALNAAAQHGDYSSDTGTRLFLWGEVARAVALHPVSGVGAGGFRDWIEPAVARIPREDRPRAHAHAHSTPLHIVATTGLVGLGLAIAFIVACLRGAFRRGPDGRLDPAAVGAGVGLIGLLLAGLFDPVHINAQTAALLYTLVAFTITPRPSPPPLLPPRIHPRTGG